MIKSVFLLMHIWSLNVQQLRGLTTVEIGFAERITQYGRVRGILRSVYGAQRVEMYLGVPYARPPIGKFRLERPVPPKPWGNRIRLAISMPPACPQPVEGLQYIEYHLRGFNRSSEDCLYLNIYLPQKASRKRLLPVLVFIHGGSYQNGMGGMLDGTMLALRGIVVVTMNYRLGPLGFLTASDHVIPGNYGMLDQVAALQWIQANIHKFGGDANQVTLDGHSAGGCSVGLHQLSPLSKGLFHRIIQQSGSPLANWAVKRHSKGKNFYFRAFVNNVGCDRNTSHAIKACIQSLSSSDLELVILDEFEWTLSLQPQYQPTVDGYFLRNTPENLALNTPLNVREYMMGTTSDEGIIAATPFVKFYEYQQLKRMDRRLHTLLKGFTGDLPHVQGIVDAILEIYGEWPLPQSKEYVLEKFSQIVGDYYITAPTYLYAHALSSRGVSVYIYSYDYHSVNDLWPSAIHGSEINYLSGLPIIGQDVLSYDTYDIDDRTMSRMLISVWANFVKLGVPSHGSFRFLPYSRGNTVYTSFNNFNTHPALTTERDYASHRMSFWNERVPELYKEQQGTVSYIVSSGYSQVQGRPLNISPIWILASLTFMLLTILVLISACYFRIRRQLAVVLRWKSANIIS